MDVSLSNNLFDVISTLPLPSSLFFNIIIFGKKGKARLRLIDCKLWYLFQFPSDGVSKLENVVTLRLDNNRLKRLPAEIGKMSSLHELSCSNNPDLDVLPDSIGLLRNLQVLYADNNKLSELPKNIGSCTSLTILSLANNRLTKVPEEIGRLSNLKMLNLTNNSIRNLPVTVLGLTKLGALWLTERQDKPLVTLNREFDQESNSYVVTCCLLPQLPKPGNLVASADV